MQRADDAESRHAVEGDEPAALQRRLAVADRALDGRVPVPRPAPEGLHNLPLQLAKGPSDELRRLHEDRGLLRSCGLVRLGSRPCRLALAAAGVTGIDLSHLLIDGRFDSGIAVDPRPRRHADLHERQPLTQVRSAPEQQIQRVHPLRDALRVVEAIDANANQRGIDL